MEVSGYLHITVTLPPVSIKQKVEWAPKLVWKLEKSNVSCPCQDSKDISVRDYKFIG
jgi:hypothetical protein